jgi:hypothetical protein
MSNEPGAPGTGFVRVRHMPCRAAYRAIRRGRIVTEETGSTAAGEEFTYNLETRGFSCKTLEGGVGGAVICCSRRTRVFVFNYGT